MRKIIFHYHLFKNAGTSLDAGFKQNLKNNEWITREFPGNPKQNRDQVRQWILDNPQAICFSSHTALLPPPEVEGIEVLPVIFIRHPIDRIASAYAFERRQGGDTFGAVLARNTDLKGYIETRLALPNDRQCRNFHTERLSGMLPVDHGSELERAIGAVQRLPFVGLVEDFDKCVARLETLASEFGIADLKLAVERKNVSQDAGKSLKKKLKDIRSKIGDDFYQHLLEANSFDISLYDHLIESSKSKQKENFQLSL